jgi:hypothetical protein
MFDQPRSENGWHTGHYVHEVANELSDVLERLLAAAGGDASKAAELLEAEALNDDDLREKIVRRSLPAMCRETVNAWYRSRRSKILNGGGQSVSAAHLTAAPADLTQRGDRLREVASRALLDLPLPVNQKPLRDASVEDVRAATNYYDKRAKTFRRRAEFMKRVLKRMELGKAVGECLSERELREIWNEN